MNKQAVRQAIDLLNRTPVAKLTHPKDRDFFSSSRKGENLVCPMTLFAYEFDPDSVNGIASICRIVQRTFDTSVEYVDQIFYTYDNQPTKIAGKRAVIKLLEGWL